MNMTIRDGSVFGLIGTNGSGKSTFLRMAAGVFRGNAAPGAEMPEETGGNLG